MRSPASTLVRSFRNAAGDSPVRYVGGSGRSGGVFGQAAGGSPSNTEALLSATAISGTCFAVVNRTSNATAQVQWKLYRKPKNQQTGYGDDDNRTEILSHQALVVLNRPNTFMNQHRLFETVQQWIDIVGEGPMVFGHNGQPNGRGGYVPSSIWPVRPDKLAPVPDPAKFIAGWVYSGPDGEKIPLANAEVMAIQMPNPMDLFRGLGPVRSILATLDAEKYSTEWNRNFFINSAEPGGIIQVPDTWDDPDFDKFVKRWGEMHRGVSKAHRIALLEGGAQWVANSMNHKDMQFTELRTVSRDAVLEAFGMPGSMIGISEHVNKANAQTGEVTFARWIVRQRLDRWKDALNQDFLPLFGATADGLEFDYIDPTPTDDAAETAALLVRAQFAVAMVGAGWGDVEVLETAGLPAMPFEKPATPLPVHILPPGNNPAAPEGQPDDAEEMANA